MAALKLQLLARSFSSSAALQQMVKPPIQVFGLEGRYAMALFSAASKEKKLDVVEKDLRDFGTLLKKDPKLNEFISNPTLKRDLKKSAIADVLKKTGACNLTVNLMVTMAENGRIKNMEGVMNAYRTIMSAQRGEVNCEVITAKPLDEAQLKELQSALKAFMKSGQVLQLQTKVDPSIIGGMVVSIGDKYVDMSIATKIKKFTQVLEPPV